MKIICPGGSSCLGLIICPHGHELATSRTDLESKSAWDNPQGPVTNLVFRYGSGAVSLLKELLKLDWRTRINAVDALQHSWFKMAPLPLEPHEIPVYEESHELDRRKFHDRKAA